MSRTLELLERLVAFPTISHASNLALIEWAQSVLQDAGFAVTRIPSPCGDKAGLHARIGPDLPGGICLSGHTDVVPTEGQIWTRDPFKLTDCDTRVYGRGTTDMKAFVASALALAERAAHSKLKQPLSIVLSYDEEVGCVGIRDMLSTLGPLLRKPRLVLVGEPTSMRVATGHKGKATFAVRCNGQAGHSALAPEFVNALHVAADFIQEIRALQERLKAGPHDDAYSVSYSTVHIGEIRGGRALNMVPELVELSLETRHIAETPMQEIQHQIEEIAEKVSDAHPSVPGVAIEITNAYPGLNSDPSGLATEWASKLSGNLGTSKVPFGTEAGYFASLGLNTVVVGPGDMSSDGHKPDEGLSKKELSACDDMMENILTAISSGA